jgi:hypothetical protein
MTEPRVAGAARPGSGWSSATAQAVLRRWPAVAGLGFAALVAYGMTSGLEMAAVLAASAVVYIGCAAIGKQRAAWPMFLATVVIITVMRVLDVSFDPAWAVLGAGILLGGYGLVRGAVRPGYGLPLQTLAYLGFGGAAALALFINPTIGSCLVAVGLLGHAAWDVYHHRTNRVVARSLAEFCLFLDTALAIIIIVITVTS